jgi:hypothetical protein
MKAWGMPDDVIEECKGQGQVEDFEVLAENWETLSLFLRMGTQWTASNGVVLGMNYQSLEFLFRAFQVIDHAKTLDDIQAMESAAVAVMNER